MRLFSWKFLCLRVAKCHFPQNKFFDVFIAVFQSVFFNTIAIKTVLMAEFLCMHACMNVELYS